LLKLNCKGGIRSRLEVLLQVNIFQTNTHKTQHLRDFAGHLPHLGHPISSSIDGENSSIPTSNKNEDGWRELSWLTTHNRLTGFTYRSSFSSTLLFDIRAFVYQQAEKNGTLAILRRYWPCKVYVSSIADCATGLPIPQEALGHIGQLLKRSIQAKKGESSHRYVAYETVNYIPSDRVSVLYAL